MASMQLNTGDRTEPIEILERSDNKIRLLLGEKEYNLDIVRVENNIYSLLLGNRIFDIEVVPSGKKNSYSVKYHSSTFNVQVIDAQMKYMQNRLKAAGEDDINIITCPMPGKIVKILVKAGDQVEAGQVVITVSAMKMESEYKSGKMGVVKEIRVAAGDIVDANIPLIILE